VGVTVQPVGEVVEAAAPAPAQTRTQSSSQDKESP